MKKSTFSIKIPDSLPAIITFFPFRQVLSILSLVIAASFSPCMAEEKEGWQKAEGDDQYPPLYSDTFIDSLLSSNGAFIAKRWRSSPGADHFSSGEKLVYKMGWGPLHAGFAILSSEPDTVNGTTVIIGKGATNSFFSAFYKIRDCYRTIIDTEGMYPLFFDQHISEGKYHANRWDLYDQVQSLVYTEKKKPPFFKNKPFAQSLLSLVYYMRTLTFSPGDSLKIDCFVDTMCHTIHLRCMERKTITVDAGTFDCLLVKPSLVGKGRVFSKEDDIRVWFTNDADKMPVAIESKISWGTLYARLTWYSKKG
jgi:hypothetical protein